MVLHRPKRLLDFPVIKQLVPLAGYSTFLYPQRRLKPWRWLRAGEGSEGRADCLQAFVLRCCFWGPVLTSESTHGLPFEQGMEPCTRQFTSGHACPAAKILFSSLSPELSAKRLGSSARCVCHTCLLPSHRLSPEPHQTCVHHGHPEAR